MKPDASMMHASDYAGQNPRGWIVTEKLDGFFARWTGSRLLTREGVDYNAPEWFTECLPCFALDCELFAGYGRRTFLNSAPKWRDNRRWSSVSLLAFDVPNQFAGSYTFRHHSLVTHCTNRCAWFGVVQQWTCSGKAGLVQALEAITHKGGEGLVIRHPSTPYTIGRVDTMLKLKPGFIR